MKTLTSKDLNKVIETITSKGANLMHRGSNYAIFDDDKLGYFDVMYFYSESNWVAFKDLSSWEKGSKIVKLFNL